MRTSFSTCFQASAWFAASLAGLVDAQISSDGSTVVDLGYAKYRGVQDSSLGVTSYLGIYYAAPPTGERRWRAPVDIEQDNIYNPEDVQDATIPGPQCWQSAPQWSVELLSGVAAALVGGSGVSVGDENCLLLDVRVPTFAKSNNLPVVVDIHGGGYTTGNSTADNGSNLVAHADGNIIHVAIQYRLGPQGFLASSAVRDNGVANAGLLDQRAAIEWVKRNIRAFGGDPNKITIWGGSAGGGSVMAQMILYGGEENPPFRAAISQFPGWLPHRNNTILDIQYQDLLFATNCDSLRCLRQVSSERLANATASAMAKGYQKRLYGYGDFYFTPAVDGHIIRDLPTNEWKRGHFTKVPLLTDRNGHEGLAFTNLSITPDEIDQTSELQAYFPAAQKSFFTRLYQLYDPSRYGPSYFASNTVYRTPLLQIIASVLPNLVNNTAYTRVADIWGDSMIVCPTVFQAIGASNYVPTWKLNCFAGSELHGAAAAFLYQPSNTTGNTTLANMMKDYYLSFVTELDPNTISYSNASKPYWPQFGIQTINGTQQNVAMRVNQTNIAAQPDVDVNERCDFWSSQSYAVPY